MKKFLLLLLPIFFISYAIYSNTDNKHIFYLDNPTNKNIKTINSIENSLFIFHLQSG